MSGFSYYYLSYLFLEHLKHSPTIQVTVSVMFRHRVRHRGDRPVAAAAARGGARPGARPQPEHARPHQHHHGAGPRQVSRHWWRPCSPLIGPGTSPSWWTRTGCGTWRPTPGCCRATRAPSSRPTRWSSRGSWRPSSTATWRPPSAPTRGWWRTWPPGWGTSPCCTRAVLISSLTERWIVVALNKILINGKMEMALHYIVFAT